MNVVTNSTSKRVALLMSGGVDSSYCAYLLKKQGYVVTGIYLKLHDKEEKHKVFINNCEKAAKHLNIDFRVIDAKKDFREAVYNKFIDSYQRGETPNPCALCNPLMKFGLALEKALELGCEYIATGHYAQITELNGIKRIKEARDKTKDQSYFLYAISQSAIDRLIFPLGDKIKEEIKPLALKLLPWLGSLETYKDSQEICFVETDYIDVLKKHIEVDKKGNVLDIHGNVVGEHKGYMHYTIGKRKGFSVKGALNPHFVLSINPRKNEIIVGEKINLKVDVVKADNKSLPSIFAQKELEVKVRYRSARTKALINIENNTITATLQEPVFGVAKGQALVVYKDDVVLGGGVIV